MGAMMRRLLAVLAGAGLMLTAALPSSAEPVFTNVGTHPSIAAQPTAAGKTISDLAFMDGKLYMGYGDWNGNTGPIDVATYDVSTGMFGVELEDVPTEALSTYRKINGALYVTEVDPRTGWTEPAGYATNAGGYWHSVRKTPGQHFFDIATATGSDLWLFGSRSLPDGSEGGAVAYRSTDGGNTWAIASTDVSNPSTGYERYYWAGVAAGSLWFRADGGSGTFSPRYFDGSSVRKSKVSAMWPGTAGQTQSYRGLLYGGNYVFDGRRSTYDLAARDYYLSDDSYLYALTPDAQIMRTGGSGWTQVGTAPTGARSLAVEGGRFYVGMTDGSINIS